MTDTREKMTAEEMEALRQKVAKLNLTEASALITSIAEEEGSKELIPFIMSNLDNAVVIAMAQRALDRLICVEANNE